MLIYPNVNTISSAHLVYNKGATFRLEHDLLSRWMSGGWTSLSDGLFFLCDRRLDRHGAFLSAADAAFE